MCQWRIARKSSAENSASGVLCRESTMPHRPTHSRREICSDSEDSLPNSMREANRRAAGSHAPGSIKRKVCLLGRKGQAGGHRPRGEPQPPSLLTLMGRQGHGVARYLPPPAFQANTEMGGSSSVTGWEIVSRNRQPPLTNRRMFLRNTQPAEWHRVLFQIVRFPEIVRS